MRHYTRKSKVKAILFCPECSKAVKVGKQEIVTKARQGVADHTWLFTCHNPRCSEYKMTYDARDYQEVQS